MAEREPEEIKVSRDAFLRILEATALEHSDLPENLKGVQELINYIESLPKNAQIVFNPKAPVNERYQVIE